MSSNPMKSNQNYCLTKLFDQAQLFGDCRRQRGKLEQVEEDKFVGHVFEFELNLPNSTPCFQCSFSNDGRYMASNHNDAKIHVTDLESGKVINVLDGRSKYSWSLAFHPIHSHILASAGLNGNVRVFDTNNQSSQEWHNPTAVQNMTVTSLAFHPTLDLLAIASNCQLFFWNWRTGEDVSTVSTGKLSQKVRLVKFDCKGRLIAVISNESHSGDSAYMRPSSLVNYMLSREYGASNNGGGGAAGFPGAEGSSNLSILRNVFRLSSVSSTNAASSAANLASSDPPPQQQANSNLNNLRNIVSQIQRQPTPGEAAFRLADNGSPSARPQNRSSEEALYNFASALADSIRSDQLLPDDLPSFSFLRSNYQTSTPSLRQMADRMREYFQMVRRDSDQIVINNSNTNNNNNEPANEGAANRSSSNSAEDLNALIFESVNVVERFISRQRTMQENWSAPESPSNSGSMPYRNRDYIIRRRLSRQILRPAQQADTQRSSSLEEASAAREISSSISRTVIDTLRESRSMRQSGSRAATNSPASQSTSSSATAANRSSSNNMNNSNSNGNSGSSNSPDNHSLFYYFLQHQAFRSGARQELNSGVPSSEISAIVNQIQRSIAVINLNNPHLANEEMQQLHASGHAVLQRIIYFIKQREKLCHYKQIILNMLVDSDAEQRNELQRFFGFVQLLIRQADEIQRTLINDLRFFELSRLHLMRRRTADMAARQSEEAAERSLNEESSSSDTQSSSSSSAAGNATQDDAVPSTSRGITQSKRKSEEGADEEKNKAKKFKIPVVRISTNEGDEESQPSGSNSPATSSPTSSPTRDQQLRAEMNRLISNLEILFERLSNSSRMNVAHSFAPNFVNSLNFFSSLSALPILSPRTPMLISARLINSSSLNSAASPSGGQSAANPPQHFATFYIAQNPGQFLNNEFAQLHSLNADLNQTTYRILCFELKQEDDLALSIDLSRADSGNLVVPKSKVANDSSVDLSRNGELLACLVPIEGSSGLMLSIFSIRKASLGDCLFVYGSVNAISVSFSPSSKYVVLGLAPSRLYGSGVNEEQVEIAQIFMLSDSLANMMREFSNKTRDQKRLLTDDDEGDKDGDLKRARRSKADELVQIKSVNALRNDDYLSSIKWLPTKDSRLIYCTSSGQSVWVRASSKKEHWYDNHMSNILSKPPSDILLSSISPRSAIRDQRL